MAHEFIAKKGLISQNDSQISGSLKLTGQFQQGHLSIATGDISHAEGYSNAVGDFSHAEGYLTEANGSASHAEGFQSITNGTSAHAEGSSTANGDGSHAEGGSTANGLWSHAEGYGSVANQFASHAGGLYTTANGIGSHTEGSASIAAGNFQTVVGLLNIPNSQSLFIVGSGSSNTSRLNLLQVDPDGIYVNGKISGSNITASNATIDTLTVTGLLNATQISGSQVYITSSQLVVTDNILQLNASYPHLRYAGIEVWDSGSTDQMSSILWDGKNNYFFVSSSDANYSRKIITGPDSESDLTVNYIPLATGSSGLKDSIISQIGNNSINVNGSVTASVFYGTASMAITSSYVSASNVQGLTNGYVPFATGSGLINSIIYQTGSNIGIGTTTPTTALSFPASAKISWPGTNQYISSTGDYNMELSTRYGVFISNNNNQGTNLPQGCYTPIIKIYQGADSAVYCPNIAPNTSSQANSPSTKFDIAINATNALINYTGVKSRRNAGDIILNGGQGGTSALINEDGGDAGRIISFLKMGGSGSGAAINGLNGEFVVRRISGSITSDIFNVEHNGNVGIGTSSPVNKLDVVGNISCSVITASIINNPSYVDFNSNTPSWKEGRIFYNNTDHTLCVYNDQSDVTLNVGQEQWVRIVAGENIPNGSAVYISGSTGTLPIGKLALADGGGIKSHVIGVSTQTINSGSQGLITSLGQVHGLDTSAYLNGQTGYLSSTVSGSYTATPPSDPYETVRIGVVLFSDVTNGIIQVDINSLPAMDYPFVGMTSVPTIVSSSVSPSGSIITVGQGRVNLCSTSDGLGQVKNYLVPSASFAITSSTNDNQYIYAKYNNGSPIYDISTERVSIDSIQSTVVYTVLNGANGQTVYSNWDEPGILLANKDYLRVQSLRGIERERGLALGESGSRYITLTDGYAWQGVNRLYISASNSATDRTVLIYHSASVFQNTLITQYDNTQYDDGTNLQLLTGNNYVVNWVYKSVVNLGTTLVQLGTAYNKLADAISSQPPTPPSELKDIAVLCGRAIYQQNNSNATQIDSAFVQTFIPAGITEHNNLNGLQGGTTSEYYHLTGLEYTGSGGGGAFLRQTGSLYGTSSIAILSDTASYINPNNIGLIPSSSYSLTSSYANKSTTADTASYFNGTVPTASYVSASNVQGLTNGYIPVATGSGLINSIIYQTGSNIGIGNGKTTPAYNLDVSGSISANNYQIPVGGMLYAYPGSEKISFVGNSGQGSILIATRGGVEIDTDTNNNDTAGTAEFLVKVRSDNSLVARLNANGTGDIGIGTITPTAKLHISGSTANEILLNVQNNIGSSSLFVSSSGNVGIGTILPTAPLHVGASISNPVSMGIQSYGTIISPTFTNTTASQTQTAFRVLPTFTGSYSGSNTTNIIADFGATSIGTQLSVNDITSGSIYMVNDVSGLPIIEALSDWSVNMYQYPNIVFRKSGSYLTLGTTATKTGSVTVQNDFILNQGLGFSSNTTMVTGSTNGAVTSSLYNLIFSNTSASVYMSAIVTGYNTSSRDTITGDIKATIRYRTGAASIVGFTNKFSNTDNNTVDFNIVAGSTSASLQAYGSASSYYQWGATVTYQSI